MASRLQSLIVRLIAKAAGAVAIYIGLSLLTGLISLTYAVEPIIPSFTAFVGTALILAGVLALLS
ncbi:MAG: hypothetical protein NZ988_01910 [Thaumarchaeota archaeon]|nr:hypothetical protein [Candidatus Calditenuaceae archaeon]MDW8186791.1 hypothetical protein [Nitrososphaerota archaeon]